jgi:hypothetical protein
VKRVCFKFRIDTAGRPRRFSYKQHIVSGNKHYKRQEVATMKQTTTMVQTSLNRYKN